MIDTLYTSLSIAPKPSIRVKKSNNIDCTINAATLTAVGANNYRWTPIATLSNSKASPTIAMPAETTTYHVFGTGSNGCVAEDSVKVEVLVLNAEHGYQLPSAFTPNNDGINDCFGIRKWSVVNELDFSVYNRWGSLLFHGNKASDCWDGTYKGVPQTTGTYIYIIKAKTLCGNVYRKGTLVLIR
jgi:gliding motility-associated-like protein